MSDELKDSGTVTALSVIGLVFGLVGMLGSFIPCIGSLAFYIGIPAAIVSGIALIIAHKQKAKRTFAIVALTISLIGVVISGWQYFSIMSVGKRAEKYLRGTFKEKETTVQVPETKKESTSKKISDEQIIELDPTYGILLNINIYGNFKLNNIEIKLDSLQGKLEGLLKKEPHKITLSADPRAPFKCVLELYEIIRNAGSDRINIITSEGLLIDNVALPGISGKVPWDKGILIAPVDITEEFPGYLFITLGRNQIHIQWDPINNVSFEKVMKAISEINHSMPVFIRAEMKVPFAQLAETIYVIRKSGYDVIVLVPEMFEDDGQSVEEVFPENISEKLMNEIKNYDWSAKPVPEPEKREGPEPIRAIGEVRPPTLIKRVEPIYPEIAREARVEGIVICEVTTDTNGRVVDVKILRSIPFLDEAAVNAIKQWLYEPMIIDGSPRGVIFTVTYRFVLKQNGESGM